MTRDPEMRYTANGKAVTSFSVAVNMGKDQTEWFNVVAWEKLAETCGQYLEKGKRVYCEGRLATRSWEAPDKTKKYRTELVAHQVIFLSERGRQSDFEGEDIELDDLPFD